MVLAKALCLIVCIGDAFQYDVSKTHVFFENSLMSIYKANQSLQDVTQEKLFIIISGLIPVIMPFLQAKPMKKLAYKTSNENLPSFDEVF